MSQNGKTFRIRAKVKPIEENCPWCGKRLLTGGRNEIIFHYEDIPPDTYWEPENEVVVIMPTKNSFIFGMPVRWENEDATEHNNLCPDTS